MACGTISTVTIDFCGTDKGLAEQKKFKTELTNLLSALVAVLMGILHLYKS